MATEQLTAVTTVRPRPDQAIRALSVILSMYPEIYREHRQEIDYYRDLFLMYPNTPGYRRIQDARRNRMGFLRPDDVQAIAADPATRLHPLIIRCHEARCYVPADQLETVLAALERGGLTVRDVSILAE